MPTTPRYALATPLGIDLDNVPQWILALVTQLDNNLAGFAQGTFAGRPAVGVGRFYWATDTLQLWFTDGTSWSMLTGIPTHPCGNWYMPPGYPLAGVWQPAAVPMILPWTAAAPADRPGFAIGGSTIPLPAPGDYRIRAQVTYVCNPNQPPMAELALARPNGERIGGRVRIQGLHVSYTPVFGIEVEATVAFDFSDANHQSFYVQFFSTHQANIQDYSTLFVELVNAL